MGILNKLMGGAGRSFSVVGSGARFAVNNPLTRGARNKVIHPLARGAKNKVINYGRNKIGSVLRPEVAAFKGALGAGATFAILRAPVYAFTSEYDRSNQQWHQGREGAHMAKMLSMAQEGPFGTGARPYQGMGANHSGAAGMTLALHYAKNGSGIRSYGMLG